MAYQQYFLIVAAVIPAIALCVYIYRKDSVEKEPLSLLLGLLVLGAMSTVPASFLEEILDKALVFVFGFFARSTDGGIVLEERLYWLYQLCSNVLGVALVEEGCKFLGMYWLTRKNRAFNSLFDGVVYAVFVSLGFAGLENILYVLQYGWGTAIARAVTSVPGHCFFGVLMGLHYTQWRIYSQADKTERFLAQRGLLVVRRSHFAFWARYHLRFALVIPTIIHGLYDFCLSIESGVLSAVYVGLMVGLYAYSFYRVRRLSKKDSMNDRLVAELLARKYPQVDTALLYPDGMPM